MARFDPHNKSPYRDSADERDVLDFDEEPGQRTTERREGQAGGRGEASRDKRRPPTRDAQRDRDDFPRSRR